MNNNTTTSRSRVAVMVLMIVIMGIAAFGYPDECSAITKEVNKDNLTYAMNEIDGGVVSTKASGKPKILIFSSNEECCNTTDLLDSISAGFDTSKASIVVGLGATQEEVKAFRRNHLISGAFYCYEADDVFSAYINHLSLSDGSWNTPLVVFINANNKIVGYSTGYIEDFFNEVYKLLGIDISKPTNSYQLSYSVFCEQPSARSICSMINSFRTGSDAWYYAEDNVTKVFPGSSLSGGKLSALQYDYDLEKVAIKRAKEIALSYTHTRPNGSSFWKAHFECGYLSGQTFACGENIAVGYRSAEGVHEAWREDEEDYEGQGHRRSMLNPNFKAVGIAHVSYGGLEFWVEEFTDKVSSTTATAACNDSVQCNTNVAEARIESVKFFDHESSYEINLNEADSISVPDANIGVVMLEEITRSACRVDNPVTYSIEDADIARIDGNKILALKQGETNLILEALGHQKKVPLRITGDTSNVHSDFYCKKSRHYTGQYGFYYKDAYFNNPATQYNHSLATMSLCMALSTYNDRPKNNSYDDYDKYIRQLMRKCGFAGQDGSNYEQYDFNVRPTNDSIGCAIGSKQLEDGTTLIAVAVRSSGYEAEWASNFSVGKTGDHEGFKKSAGIVKDFITDYIQTHNGISGNIKIWITGFSRGGAVATQCAALLNNAQIQGVSFTKNDIYAYGFATPAGAVKQSNPNSSSYNNIFNLVHYHDLVPLVAPSTWGFKRYGTTLVFPYSESRWKYADYELEMEYYYEDLTGESYKLDSYVNVVGKLNTFGSVGVFNRLLVTKIALTMGRLGTGINARSDYQSKFQNMFTTAAGRAMSDEKLDKDDASVLLYVIGQNEMPQLLFKFAGDPLKVTTTSILATAAKNRKLLAAAHMDAGYYLAWMQIMDSNYGSSLTPTFCTGAGRIIRVNCPVDINVIDTDGWSCASIMDEEVEEYFDHGVQAFIDENGQKTISLPIDEEYRVEITPRQSCNVTVTVEETTGFSAEPSRIINYEIPNVKEEQTITADADSYTTEEQSANLEEGSTAEYSVTKNGNTVEPSAEYRGEEEIASHSYMVNTQFDETKGAVFGAGVYTEGSYVQLEAAAADGYYFKGFYLNGALMKDDNLDNDRNTVRMKVTKDTEVEAVFLPLLNTKTTTVKGLSNKVYNGKTMKPAVTVKYRNTVLSAGKDYTVSYKKNKSVGTASVSITGKGNYYGSVTKTFKILPKGTKIKSISRGKKTFTVKWKKQLLKMSSSRISGYQIMYSTSKSFKKGNKTIKVKGSTKGSKKVTKLKAKKKYYVKIRTFKTVGGKNYYSAWSKAKAVKTK